MSTYLVTGAAGFIASHTCEALLKSGHRVIGIDNFDPFYSRELKEANLAAIREAGSDFVFYEGDLADAEFVKTIFEKEKPETIIHLAAKAGVRPSIEDPAGYVRANILATQILLNESSKSGVKRFVMASSSSVYGNAPTVPFSETQDVNQPISPYAATKRACELIAYTHNHLTKLPIACLRFFTVFGPRQRPDLAIQKFLKLIAEEKPIPFFGDGSTSRDYTYIDDIVAGILSAADHIDQYGYRIWNLGGSSPVSLSEMVATIGEVVGKEPILDKKPMQPGDVERTYADLTRSEAELGYKPTTSFKDGVKKQWEYQESLTK